VKTVWVCLDSIRAGITFFFMRLSRYTPSRGDKNKPYAVKPIVLGYILQ